MGIKEYGPGDHDAGFIGFRVTFCFDGEYRQAYFSTVRAKYQDDRCLYFKRQRLRAELQDAEWAAESALYQYRRFVTENSSNTKPFRGVGVHGITLGFHRPSGTSKWTPHIAVSRPGRPSVRKTFKKGYFSAIWAQCVELWATEYGVLEGDRQRVLNNPPNPTQFKDLRRHMNEVEGHDIPASALSDVFREQRDQLKATRILKPTTRKPALADHFAPQDSDRQRADTLEAEMATWFEKERQQFAAC
ncbi:hypothetical protein [Marinobacter lutaoensis]|uniref:hypothetical protein n=1 Tax=Marinobacter lutaoensis TaxID=135739 RepID=UPI0011156244|nr:hypothetical protein [Marinobacter lutaoensis]